MSRRGRIALLPVRTAAELAAVRTLFVEYRQWLAHHREVTAFPDPILEVGLEAFDKEIAKLPGPYAPPRGRLLLAKVGGGTAGCGALRPIGEGRAELKRVFVRPGFRGLGVGRRIAEAALVTAHRLGYARVVLDTLPRMTAAIALYRRLGFVETPPYWDHPVPGALFFEYRFGTAWGRPSARRGRAVVRRPSIRKPDGATTPSSLLPFP